MQKDANVQKVVGAELVKTIRQIGGRVAVKTFMSGNWTQWVFKDAAECSMMIGRWARTTAKDREFEVARLPE